MKPLMVILHARRRHRRDADGRAGRRPAGDHSSGSRSRTGTRLTVGWPPELVKARRPSPGGATRRILLAHPHERGEERRMFSLTGKSCVVTGASRGLGRAIALAFAEQGADVVLAARSVGDLTEVAREVEAKGRRAVAQPTDVTDARQLAALAARAVASFGGL